MYESKQCRRRFCVIKRDTYRAAARRRPPVRCDDFCMFKSESEKKIRAVFGGLKRKLRRAFMYSVKLG